MSLKVGDLIPIGGGGYSLLSNVENFEVASIGDQTVRLKWRDPNDVVVDGILITEWAGTQIRGKKGNYPSNEKDGELFIDSKNRNQYQSTPLEITGLDNGDKYFFMAFPYTDKNVFTVDSANRVTATPKGTQSAPPAPTVSNIEHDRARVTGVSGTEVRLGTSGTWYDSPHTFTRLNDDTRYYAYARYKETSTHYASPASSSRSFTTPIRAPGPATLIAGNMQAGFFGEASASELISGTDLASMVGISEGSSQNSTAGWLKFAYKGKILFVAKKPFRNNISWDGIDSANAVYGGKTVEIDDLTYKIRLMKGALTDPCEYKDPDRGAHGSEWNRLMLPIHEQAIDDSWDYPDYVENDIPVWSHNLGNGSQGMYNDSDLVVGTGFGRNSWCQETSKDNSNRRVYRGENGVSYSYAYTSSNRTIVYGWRPVLELVQN